MDYDEIIKKLGELGKYQKILILSTFIPIVFRAFTTLAPNFYVGEQLYRCKIPWLDNDTYTVQGSWHLFAINITIPVNDDGAYAKCHLLNNGTKEACTEWVYDRSVMTNTLVSQFNLVCEKQLAKSHAVMATFLGHLTAPIIMNPLADLIGRRIMFCINVTILFVVNITIPFSTSVYMFAILRFIDGVGNITLYQVAFILGIELVGTTKRKITGIVILLCQCLGEFMLAFMAYFIRDWRWLQLAMTLPMAISLYCWSPTLLPESARWLISRGRVREALVILRRAAIVNKVDLPDEVAFVKVKENEDVRTIEILRQLMRSRKLLLFWLVTIANWFIISFTYYGITMNIGKLGGDLFVAFPLMILMATAGYVLCFTMDRIGHKTLHLVALIVTGISCLSSMFVIMYADDSFGWLITVFALIGKLFVSTAFAMIYIYTGEIFPTVLRSFVLGTCSFFARIGSVSSPYLYQLVSGKLRKALPLILYGSIIILVALMSLYLPETRKTKLPEQVVNAERTPISNEEEEMKDWNEGKE